VHNYLYHRVAILLRLDFAIPIRNVKHNDFSSNLDTTTRILEKGGKKDFLPNLARLWTTASGREWF
jgi:hypothetical protein